MRKQVARLRAGLVFVLGIVMFCSSAFAMEMVSRQDNGRDNRQDNGRDNRQNNGRDSREERHYYRDGRWYKHDSRGNEIAVDVLGIGVLVESLPPRYTTVVVQNTQYYHDDRYYYRQAPNGGYVVVSQPVEAQLQPQNNFDARGGRGNTMRNQDNRGENR